MPGVCPRCLREVYFAEEKLALGKVWHTFCFSCRNCRKLLDSCTVATHCGELFCRNCCARLFVTSGQPASPPASRADTLVDTRTSLHFSAPPQAPVSVCDSLSNCCCCCCCAEDCPIGETHSEQTGIRLDCKRRLRGGGGEEEEEEEGDYRLAEGTKRCSESDCSNLAIVNSITALCNSPSSPTAVTAWYNRQHSASQSTFGCQSCTRRRLVRPGTAPHPRNNNNANICTINSNGINCINGNKCLAPRRPGSPCRSVIQQHYQRQNRYNQQQEYLQQLAKPTSNNHELNSIRPSTPSSLEGRQPSTNCQRRDSRTDRSHVYKINPKIISSKRKTPCQLQRYVPRKRRVSFFSDVPEKDDSPLPKSNYHPTMQNNDNNNYSNNNHTNNSHDDRYYDLNEARSRHFAVGESGCTVGGGGGGGCCCCRRHCCCSARERCCSGEKIVHEEDVGDLEEVAYDNNDNDNDDDRRMRGGCGECGGCCGRSGSYGTACGCGGISNSGNCCKQSESGSRSTGYEVCPPRDTDSCCRLETAAICSPPCTERQGCCPPSGCRTACRKEPRCYPPCNTRPLGCGGGGCCGNGCRGGCGTKGRSCAPLRPCSTPPCQSSQLHYRTCSSPCSPPRPCPPQPPCCRIPNIAGTACSVSGGNGGGGRCCRSKSPGGRMAGGCCSSQDNDMVGSCQSKLPPGCECLGGGLDCQRCGRKVYQAEMQIASGVPYHNICFSCFCCRKPLESLTYQENCGEIYCKQCYVRNFGPQGYGYGVGAGVLQTPM